MSELLPINDLHYYRVLQANADGIVIVDRRGMIRYANPAAEGLFGRQASSLLGANFGFPVVADKTAEIYIINAEQRARPIVAEMRVVEIAWQEEVAYLASLRDVTERKRIEEALRKRESYLLWLNEITQAALQTPDFQAMLQTCADRLGDLFNADGCYITLWDEAEQTAVPGAVSHHIGPNTPLPLPGEKQQTITAVVLQSAQAVTIEQVMNSPFAQKHTAQLFQARSLIAIPLIAGQQKLGAAFVIFLQPHVFTSEETRQAEQVGSYIALALAEGQALAQAQEQHARAESLLAQQSAIASINARLYEQLQQHADELEARVAARTQELQAAYEQLQGLDRLKTKFIDDISHELRTPLANLSLYLDLLEKGKEERRAHYRQVLYQQLERLKSLVQSILRLSQLRLGQPEAAWLLLDLNSAISTIVKRQQAKMPQKTPSLTLTPHPHPLTVQGNQWQIFELITCLLENALKYTAEGEIRLRTFLTNPSGHVCLEIVDTGMGISEQDLPHIFDHFYRGQGASQSNLPGAGLGLTLAREIVHLHKGSIEIDSTLGQGTCVRVYLPLAEGET